MHAKKDEASKTLGHQAARLVAELHDRGSALFSNADVEEITGLAPKSARNFVAALVRRGVATRLKPGLFILVPFELGREKEYLGNPLVVARELAGGSDYFVSHATAMGVHQMVTQPQLVIFTSTPRAMRPRNVLGAEFRFVRCKPEHLFGITHHWATKTERVLVSDLERTVLDGLKQSEHCGGFTEVAKGYWMRRHDIDPESLVGYAIRLDVGAVIRRLGFLLELFDVGSSGQVERLRDRLTASYSILDPLLPGGGRYLARWKLRLNVTPEEIKAAVRT